VAITFVPNADYPANNCTVDYSAKNNIWGISGTQKYPNAMTSGEPQTASQTFTVPSWPTPPGTYNVTVR